MEAVYRNSKNSTFSSSFNGRKINSQDILYTSPFELSYSSSSSCCSSAALPQNQPPLLPLPLSKPHQYNRRKINMTTQQLLSVRKSSVSNGGRDKFKHQSMQSVSCNSMNGNRLGPDPMDVPKFLFSSSSGINKSVKPLNQTYPVYPVLRTGSDDTNKDDQVTKFSGSVVSTVLSPPPSSLPLPTFSLRPKLSCNAEAAAGIDAGATDSLRRILRIR